MKITRASLRSVYDTDYFEVLFGKNVNKQRINRHRCWFPNKIQIINQPTKKQTAYTLRVRPFNRKSQTHLTHSVVVVGVEPDVYEFIHIKMNKKNTSIQHRQASRHTNTQPYTIAMHNGFMCATDHSSMATSDGIFVDGNQTQTKGERFSMNIFSVFLFKKWALIEQRIEAKKNLYVNENLM